MTTDGTPQGDPTAYRDAEWKERVGDIDLRHQAALAEQQARSASLGSVAKALGVDLAEATAAQAKAYDQIEQLAQERYRAAGEGQTS